MPLRNGPLHYRLFPAYVRGQAHAPLPSCGHLAKNAVCVLWDVHHDGKISYAVIVEGQRRGGQKSRWKDGVSTSGVSV